MNSGGAAGTGFGNTNTMVGPAPMQMQSDTCVQGMRCFDRDEADENDCGHQTLDSSVKTITNPGNILLVFDTSSSMNEDWNGMQRWQAAGQAIMNALTPLQDLLTVGTVFFPRNDPNSCIDPTGIACVFAPGLGCGVTPITSADQINFQPGAQFLSAFAGGGTPLYAPLLGGLTPLSEGLQQAQTALAGATLTGITAVIVITDGDPNCAWDEAASTQIVAGWAAMGIKTYVLGVPGVGTQGETVLNNLAVAGGTQMYIPPTDPMALEAKVNEIVSSTVTSGIDSCTIDLVPPAEAPDKLHLVVTEAGVEEDVARTLSADASWDVSPDGATVTLSGTLCDAAKAGVYEHLRFDFGCVELPPAPPPVVPE
jgi:Mg-chelatase subunit ChlD